MAEVRSVPLDNKSKKSAGGPLRTQEYPYPYSPPVQTELKFYGAVIIPVNGNGKKMAPIEAATRVPLPIIGRDLDGATNRHHAFYYKDWYRKKGIALRATRFSRLQEVNVLDHKTFHNMFDGGTARPESDDVMFQLTVLGFAAYVPQFAVNAKTEEIVELSKAQRYRLRYPGIFTIEGEQRDLKYNVRAIGEFLMHYSLGRRFDIGRIGLIEEFLSLTEDRIRDNDLLRQQKDKLAMRLTNIAIGTAVSPIEAAYRQARRENFCGNPRDIVNPPRSPFEEVKRFVEGHEPRYFDTLEQNLQKQYPEAIAA